MYPQRRGPAENSPCNIPTVYDRGGRWSRSIGYRQIFHGTNMDGASHDQLFTSGKRTVKGNQHLLVMSYWYCRISTR